jgi:hypothetical protein
MFNKNSACIYPISKAWPPSQCPDYNVEVHEFDHDWLDAECLKRLCLLLFFLFIVAPCILKSILFTHQQMHK